MVYPGSSANHKLTLVVHVNILIRSSKITIQACVIDDHQVVLLRNQVNATPGNFRQLHIHSCSMLKGCGVSLEEKYYVYYSRERSG